MGDACTHEGHPRSRWPDGRAVDSSAMPAQPRWRDVAAAYLVHCGLRLASRAGARDIRAVLTAEGCPLASPAGRAPAEGG